jgi:hypothetical protein
MCPNRPVALDPALAFPMRHGSADVQQDLPRSELRAINANGLPFVEVFSSVK